MLGAGYPSDSEGDGPRSIDVTEWRNTARRAKYHMKLQTKLLVQEQITTGLEVPTLYIPETIIGWTRSRLSANALFSQRRLSSTLIPASIVGWMCALVESSQEMKQRREYSPSVRFSTYQLPGLRHIWGGVLSPYKRLLLPSGLKLGEYSNLPRCPGSPVWYRIPYSYRKKIDMKKYMLMHPRGGPGTSPPWWMLKFCSYSDQTRLPSPTGLSN